MEKKIKDEARIIGFDDAPFVKGKDWTTLVVGAVYRGGHFIDGLISTQVCVDGSDATRKLSEAVNKSKFKAQLQAILLNGIAVGGFNVVDINSLSEKTGLPVVAVVRDFPDFAKIEEALIKIGMSRKIKLLRKAGIPEPAGKVFIQHAGCTHQEAHEIVHMTSTHSNIPEPLRAAHIIAGGVVRGESKGKA